MKKVISTFLFFIVVTLAHSQTTYYWVGGTTGLWTANTSWNTALNGSGTPRSSNSSSDILIFDGSNIGGATTATGIVTPDNQGTTSFAQLKLQNGANVVLRRSISGGSTYTILGDGTAADDFTVDATSSLKITSTTAAFNFTLQLGILSTNNATGTIYGSITLDDGAVSTTTRLVAASAASALVFANGSSLNFNNRSTNSYGFTGTFAGGIKFSAGSSLIYQGTSKMYTSTDFPLTFDKGSNFILESTPNTAVSSRVFGNMIVRNNQSITLDGNPYIIDTLTINSGSTLLIKSTGNTNLTGSLINNGNFGSALSGTAYGSSALLMVGNTPQSIGGSGTFQTIGALQIAADADVTLNANITLGGTSTSSIVGKLNAQTYYITGPYTSSFNIRTAASVTTTGCNTSADGYSVVLPTAVYTTGVNTANAVAGVLVSGPDFQPNTYIIGTSSGTSTITLSKPTYTRSAVGTVSITLSNNAGTLTTANTAGLDGTITSSLKRTFGVGTNYIFNAATTTPFSDSAYLNPIGNVTFNAPITTNRTQNITGVLTINSGNLTVRPTDTLIIQTTGSVVGASASKYIALQKNTSSVGVLRMNGVTGSKVFPIGSETKYLPVTITPTSTDSVAVSIFEGATVDGTPGGTAMNATQKARIVDAIWTINRISPNSDACGVISSWTPDLEGSSFSNFANNEIGISRYSGSGWTTAAGVGDNSANTATNNTFTSFGAFGVGRVGTTLPVKISSFNAIQEQGKIKLTWNVSSEINVSNYTIEKSTDGIHFNTLLTVTANNSQSYNGYDFAPAAINYYRIKVLDNNNTNTYSSIVKIKTSSTKAELVVYPNPVVNNQLSIQLSNVAKGKTDVVIYNNVGQQVFSKSILSEAGSQTQYISLPTSIAKGLYKLVITNNETKLQETLLMQ